MKRRFRYVLDEHARERRRLALQARLWSAEAEALFDRLGVGPRWRVLEVGAGMGATFTSLCARTGPAGAAHAVERSPAFAAALRRKARARGWRHARVFESDILGAELADGRYDLIFARWVFLFLPDVEAHVRRLARLLRPGGKLVIVDYHCDGLQLRPSPRDWEDLMAAEAAFFAAEGGNRNVAGRLPALFRRAGLETVEVRAHLKAGGPASPAWRWMEDYFLDYLDRIAAYPPMNPRKAARLAADWAAARRAPGALMLAPTVLEVVGRRRPAR